MVEATEFSENLELPDTIEAIEYYYQHGLTDGLYGSSYRKQGHSVVIQRISLLHMKWFPRAGLLVLGNTHGIPP